MKYIYIGNKTSVYSEGKEKILNYGDSIELTAKEFETLRGHLQFVQIDEPENKNIKKERKGEKNDKLFS
jgi:hypothetical protein